MADTYRAIPLVNTCSLPVVNLLKEAGLNCMPEVIGPRHVMLLQQSFRDGFPGIPAFNA